MNTATRETGRELTTNSQRPMAVTVAAILLALFSVLNLVAPLIPAYSEGIPALVNYLGVALGIAGLVAVYGLWTLKRWSMLLTVIVSVPSILLAAPGILFAPTTVLSIGALVGVLGSALIIGLVVLPASRHAYA